MTAANAYPVPSEGDDPRFSVGLAVGVAHVLQNHGYPAPTAAADWVELQQCLFRFIYGPRGVQ